ncbi:serine/threonine-protein kinase, partial [Frankia sp. R82]|uniref:serine/threonine protein kinase n=1 Tax=Frankia sp. R82 TaxID=2950553 RepID=UPI00204335AD
MDARDEDVRASQDLALEVQETPNGLTTRPDPLRPGDPRLLGDYQILGRLGEGGMGTVFLGRGRDTGLVAVKVIRAEIARISRYRERFCREAAAARRMARSCTAQVFDVACDVAGALYLVTEFVDGPPLARAVAAQGPLGPADVERVAVRVATALRAMHGVGLVHRDLSPANVLLSPLGPTVIDLGLARVSDDAPRGPRGRLTGAPTYMSPEQASGHRVSGAADIFAWGGLVMFAATGAPPFGTGTTAQQLRRLQCAEPDFDRFDAALGDGVLTALVHAAMSRESATRPSADDLVRALIRPGDAPAAVSSCLDILPAPPPRAFPTVIPLTAAPVTATALPVVSTAPSSGRPAVAEVPVPADVSPDEGHGATGPDEPPPTSSAAGAGETSAVLTPVRDSPPAVGAPDLPGGPGGAAVSGEAAVPGVPVRAPGTGAVGAVGAVGGREGPDRRAGGPGA